MIEALILVAATQKEPPPITITEAERMAIVHVIRTLQQQLDEANENTYHWYRKANECEGKKQI